MLIRYKYILHYRELISFIIFILLGEYVTLCIAGILDWDTGRNDDNIEGNCPHPLIKNKMCCYAELGCINITQDWYRFHRPLNLFPLPRQVINTQFILYTRENSNVVQILKVQSEGSIQKSNFDPKKETKMIIHGFLDTPFSSWVEDMKKELLKHADWNIIVVDWSGGSLPLYTQATANTRLVGLEIAYFINYLIENHGLKAKDVHMIGHSLGAHTAGYAGEKIKGLSRITGLDPAKLYFERMPKHVRLDSTDAELVDVIHTDCPSTSLLGKQVRVHKSNTAFRSRHSCRSNLILTKRKLMSHIKDAYLHKYFCNELNLPEYVYSLDSSATQSSDKNLIFSVITGFALNLRNEKIIKFLLLL